MTVRGDTGIHRRRPGALSYGARWGVLMLDFDSPFVPGDMGNAATYDGPALFQRVEGLTVPAILADVDGRHTPAVVAAARALVTQGAPAVTSNCGFMLRYQNAVAAALGSVPVLLSSLLQLPMLTAMTAPDRCVGIVTADERVLTPSLLDELLPGTGARLQIVGLQNSPSFRATMFDGDDELDADAIRGEVVATVARLFDNGPAPAAVLLECAALPAYAAAIQQRWPGLPVHDATTLTGLVSRAAQRTPFLGFC